MCNCASIEQTDVNQEKLVNQAVLCDPPFANVEPYHVMVIFGPIESCGTKKEKKKRKKKTEKVLHQMLRSKLMGHL